MHTRQRYFRPPTRKTTYPEVALGSVENLNGDTQYGELGVRPTLDTLRRVCNKRALNGREADDHGLLHRVLTDRAEHFRGQPIGCELALL